MSAPSTSEHERTDLPAHSDGFIRGLSQVIGGPVGQHAVRPGKNRFWTAPRIIIALICVVLAFAWVQKSPCQEGDWKNNRQYTHFCYTDVLALYYAEGLNEGKVPYRDHAVEYPVVTGYFMGAIGLPVHALGERDFGINQGKWFFNGNALVLSILAVVSAALLLALRRRRPWDVAIFAASPVLLLTATVNWDFLAISLALAGLYAWSRRAPVAAGILIGLGGAAKLWPLFLLGPLLVLAVRSQRIRAFLTLFTGAAVAWLVVNLPVLIAYPDSWRRFFGLNKERPVDWGTVWYIGRFLDTKWNGSGGGGIFQALSSNITLLNIVSYALTILACGAIAVLCALAPRRPRLAQLAFLVVAAVLIFSKVWSQQYVLWLLPLLVLARPRWGAAVGWTMAELLYFVAFYAELLGAADKPVMPEGVFVLASALRLVALLVLVVQITRDIWRPELDVVRHTYPDDPDGGVFDRAPDADWVWRLRSGLGLAALVPASVAAPSASAGAPSASGGAASASGGAASASASGGAASGGGAAASVEHAAVAPSAASDPPRV
jgi:uncharacterized membrane protein